MTENVRIRLARSSSLSRLAERKMRGDDSSARLGRVWRQNGTKSVSVAAFSSSV
jgi:hypothetical protein